MSALRVALAAAGVALFAGCGSAPPIENPFAPAPTALRVDDRSSGTPLTLSRGQTLVVVLEANVSTGYRWEAQTGFAPMLVQVGTADYSARAGSPAVGAPGEMTFRFRADAPGTTALEFTYRRPFEPNVAPAKTLRYDVTVR